VYVVAFVVQADWLRAGADHDPLIIARVLASRYPENAVMSYIPALSWSGAIRLTALTDEGRWREKAQREMQPFISGEKPSIVEPYQLTSLAGHAALFDLGHTAGARTAADLILAVEPVDTVRFARGWTDDMLWRRPLSRSD
jgi:hypothetical protein